MTTFQQRLMALQEMLNDIAEHYNKEIDSWLSNHIAEMDAVIEAMVDEATPDYDPHEGEGDNEDGWTKCVVCQAFTIDPEAGRCIHWDKDPGHHEMWYAASDEEA